MKTKNKFLWLGCLLSGLWLSVISSNVLAQTATNPAASKTPPVNDWQCKPIRMTGALVFYARNDGIEEEDYEQRPFSPPIMNLSDGADNSDSTIGTSWGVSNQNQMNGGTDFNTLFDSTYNSYMPVPADPLELCVAHGNYAIYRPRKGLLLFVTFNKYENTVRSHLNPNYPRGNTYTW